MLITAGALSGASPVQKAWNVITTATSSNSTAKRKEAVAALEIAGRDRHAVSIVEAALADKDVEVREAAVAVLCAVKSRSSIPKLRAAVDDPAPEVSFA